MFSVLAVCLVVSSNIASLVSSLTVPKSYVVLIGDRVILKCNGSEWTKWTYTAWNTSTETDTYFRGQIVVSMRSRYKVDNNISKQHNIIIDSVDWAHAGRYRCIAVIEETLSSDIQLTVLGADPDCSANISVAHIDQKEQRHLNIWCSISYTGNGFPVFSWTKCNVEKNIAAGETTSYTSRRSVTSTSSIIEQLDDNDAGVAFQCQIEFHWPNNSESVLIYTWNYMLPDLGKDSDGTQKVSDFPITGLAIGGSLLFLLITAIIVSCVVHRKRVKDNTADKKPQRSSTDEDTEVQRADASDNYCVLLDRPTASQETQVYCELRLDEQQSVMSSSTKQKADNKDRQLTTDKTFISQSNNAYNSSNNT